MRGSDKNGEVARVKSAEGSYSLEVATINPATKEADHMPDLMTPEEVSAALRITRPTVLKLVKDGTIAGVKVGRLYRISRAAVEHLLAGVR